jgi:hypothetical protein
MMDEYVVAESSSEEELEEEEAPAQPLAQARAAPAPNTWARGPRAPGGATPRDEEGAQWGWLQAFPPRAACREPAPGGGAAQQALDRELGLLARAMGAPPPASPPAPTSRAAQEGRACGESDHAEEDTTDMEEDEDGAAAERAQGSVQASAAGSPYGASARPGAGGGRDADADSEDEEEAAERLAAAAAAAGMLDETADDMDRKWVDANLRDGGGGGAAGRKRASDALLSCPGCFTSLCFDCRAIGRGGRAFRAERALNCEQDGSELRCGECSTTVGSVDELGAVTFTNVLPSAI